MAVKENHCVKKSGSKTISRNFELGLGIELGIVQTYQAHQPYNTRWSMQLTIVHKAKL